MKPSSTVAAALAALMALRPAGNVRANAVTSSSMSTPSGIVGEGTGAGSIEVTTGAATTGYSFELPSGRGRETPQIGLSYSSSSGEGEAGMGWHLTGPTSIRRVPNPYSGSAQFPSGNDRWEWEGRPLVLESWSSQTVDGERTVATYLLQSEPTQARLYLLENESGWLVQHASGLVERYGYQATERFSGLAMRFRLLAITDRNGNSAEWAYSSNPTGDPAQAARGAGLLYPIHVFWTQRADGNVSRSAYQYHAALSWEVPEGVTHPLTTPTYVATPRFRLSQVAVSAMPASGNGPRHLVRRYRLRYHRPKDSTRAALPEQPQAPITGRSFLWQIQMEGRCPNPIPETEASHDEPTPPTTALAECPALPPVTYTYTAPAMGWFVHPVQLLPREKNPFPCDVNPPYGGVSTLDVNGDGYPDLIDSCRGVRIFRNLPSDDGVTRFTEDCPTNVIDPVTGNPFSTFPPFPPSVYSNLLPSLLNPQSGLTLIGRWGHSAASFLWRGLNGTAAGTDWASARIDPHWEGCFPGPSNITPRTWTLTPASVPELSSFTKKVILGGDIDGDGLADAIIRSNETASPPIEVALSRRVLGPTTGPRHVRAFDTLASSRLEYSALQEPIPGTRALLDFNGDGLADFVASDRLTPDTVATYYGEYEEPSGRQRRFIAGTRLWLSPGNGRGEFGCGPNGEGCDLREPDPTALFSQPFVQPGGATPWLRWKNDARLIGSGSKTQVYLGTVQIRSEAEIEYAQTSGDDIIYNAGHDPLRPIAFGDVNGDGFPDVVMPHTHPQRSGIQLGIHLNMGGVFLKRHCDRDPTGRTCSDADDKTVPDFNPARPYRLLIADMAASGVNQVVLLQDDGRIRDGANVPDIKFTALSLIERGQPGLLEKIVTPLGATTTFTYATYQEHIKKARLEHGWGGDISSKNKLELVTPVVERVTTRNGLTGIAASESTTWYRYRAPAVSAWTGSLRGFGEVTTIRGIDDNPEHTYRYTRSTYRYGACDGGDKLAARHEGCSETGDDEPTAVHSGKLLESVMFADDPEAPGTTKRVLSQTIYRYESTRVGTAEMGMRAAWFEYPRSVTTRLIDGAAEATSQETVVTTYQHVELPPTTATLTVWGNQGTKILYRDQHMDVFQGGNVTKTTDWGEVKSDDPPVPKDPRIVHEATYREIAPGFWVPELQSVSGEPGEPTRATRTSYDARGNVTQVEGTVGGGRPLQRFHASPAPGPGPSTAPTPAGASASGTASTAVLATFTISPWGNVLSSSGPQVDTVKGPAAVNAQTFTYDPVYEHHLIRSTIGLDGPASSPARTLATAFVVDPGLEAVTATVSPYGDLTRVEYDAFGRTVSVSDPSSTKGITEEVPLTRYEYTLPDPSGLAPLTRITQWSRDPNDLAGVGVPLLPQRMAIRYLDGLGVTRLHLAEGDARGTWIASGLAARNPRGEVVAALATPFDYLGSLESPSILIPPSATVVRRTYDDFGRPTLTEEYSSERGSRPLEERRYAPLRMSTSDANDLASGVSNIRQLDGHGRLVRVTSSGRTSESAATFFDHLPTGEVIRETRQSQSSPDFTVRERVFDKRGLMVEQTEPNTTANGRPMVYVYNDAGWLVATSDSRGCGVNIAYYASGQPAFRDFSPCTGDQQPYTPPAAYGTPAFGDGTEEFFVYDVPEPGEPLTQYGDASSLRGRLVASYDRGSHTRAKYDALGRTTGVSRRIVRPGPPADQLSARYTPHWYAREVEYDVNDRVVSFTTGADVPELQPGGDSRVRLDYDNRGFLRRMDSSHGLLIREATFRSDGRPARTVYGDLAETTMDLQYHEWRVDRLLRSSKVHRASSPALWTQPGYAPPSIDEPTQQLIVSDTSYEYDGIGNPVMIADASPEAWPSGATPLRWITYDDMNRVTGVSALFSGRDRARRSPFAHEGPQSRGVPRASLSNRVTRQDFSYDYLDNIRDWTSDDPLGQVDRHLGEQRHGSSLDGPNQLRSASGLNVAYDAAGNMVELGIARPASCDYGQSCSQGYNYAWDEIGQLASARRWDMPLNPSVSTPTWELEYAYSGGQRVLKHARGPAGEDDFTVEVFDSLRVENTAFDGLDYIRAPDTETLRLAGIGRVQYQRGEAPDGTSNRVRLFLNVGDHLGSSSFVIDHATGEIVQKTTYNAYGAVDNDYRPERWGAHREPYQFTGKEEDIEVGLIYFGARYYHPQLGRWISADPLTIHAGGADQNPYAYVRGNVFRLTDDWGLETGSPPPPPGPPPPHTDDQQGPGSDAPPRVQQETSSCTPGWCGGSGPPIPPPPPPPATPSGGTVQAIIAQGFRAWNTWAVAQVNAVTSAHPLMPYDATTREPVWHLENRYPTDSELANALITDYATQAAHAGLALLAIAGNVAGGAGAARTATRGHTRTIVRLWTLTKTNIHAGSDPRRGLNFSARERALYTTKRLTCPMCSRPYSPGNPKQGGHYTSAAHIRDYIGAGAISEVEGRQIARSPENFFEPCRECNIRMATRPPGNTPGAYPPSQPAPGLIIRMRMGGTWDDE